MKTIFNFHPAFGGTIFNSKRGFTLIELLVVMVLLAVVGTIIGAILFSSLQGASKTNTVTTVRQNGNYAISQMVKTIHDAKSFDGVSINNTSYITGCVVPDITPIPTPPQYAYLKVTSLDDQSTVFACQEKTISTIVNGTTTSMFSTSAVTLDTNSCFFTCTQSNLTDTPTIGINFSLSQYQTQGAVVLPEKQARIPFQTSVTVRNLSR